MTDKRTITRPVPADFATVAPLLYPTQLAAHYSAGFSTVMRWCSETGVKAKQSLTGSHLHRPCPADFAAVCPTMLKFQLRRHYQTSGEAINRWIAETGATPKQPQPTNRLPVPDDFAEQCARHYTAELVRHYGVSLETVNRWAKEAGCKPRKFRNVTNIDRMGNPPRVRIPLQRTWTEEDIAADELRRFGPVYRCDDKGRADQKGGFWRIGFGVLTGEELIARAARKRAA